MPYLVPALANAVAILNHLKHPAHSSANLSDIAAAASIPTSTCLNILRTLVHYGFLSFEPESKQYRLGWALLELGARVADQLSHVEVLRPHLSALAKNLGLTCILGRAIGHQLMIIDKVEGTDDMRATTTVGQYHPLTSGAVGRALLAYWDEQDVLTYIREHGLPAYTAASITDPEAFRDSLAEVRRLGYAVSIEEYYEGVNAVASAVFENHGVPRLVVGALGLASVLTRERIPEAGRLVRRTAASMTAALNGHWPGPT